MIKKVMDSNDDYHSNPLLGTSAIVSGYDSKTGLINLARVKAHLNGQLEITKQRQKIFDFGSVQHSVVLEQDLSEVVIMPKFESIPAITKKAQVEEWMFKNPGNELKCPKFNPIPGITIKAQIEEFKKNNPARYYVSDNEFKLIQGAFEVISGSDSAARMISNALHVETSFYWESKGLKVRPDLVGETDNGDLFVCNYKTIADLSKCDSHIYALKYDLRAIQEIMLIEKYFERRVKSYFFLFQEKQAPFSIRCLELSEIDMEFGRFEYQRIMNTVVLAVKEGYFPQPEFKIEQSKVYRSPQIEEF